ncbi:MAG: HDOD domain-containing protein [Desulfovibrionales bacterium]
MAILNIDSIAHGMVVQADVMDSRNRLLLPKGATITENHFRLLKQQGITHVSVAMGTPAFPGRDALEKSEGFLLPLFSYVNLNSAPIREVYRLSVLKTAQRIDNGWHPPDLVKDIPVLTNKYEDLFLKGEGTPEDLISHEIQLTSFPDIYFKIREVLNSPASTAAHMAEVVGKDTSLSAKLLRLVNSPFYGFSSRIDSITRAITLVGVEELSTLALGISAINAFKDIPLELIDMKEFWKHSIAVGAFARNLSNLFDDSLREKLFVAGILHDVGRLVMFKNLPHASTEAFLYSRANSIPLVEAEKDIFGFDHTLIGGMLLEEWKIPKRLGNIVRYHHDPSFSPNPPDAALIHLSDFLAISFLTARRGSLIVPQLQEKAWKVLNFDIKSLSEVVARTEEEIDFITALFLGDSG